MPAGIIALLVVALLIFFGLAHRALDRLRLTDAQALVLLFLLIAGSFVDIPLTRGALTIRVNVGGAVVPLLISLYLLARADSAVERLRAVAGAVVTAALVLAVSSVTDFDPGRGDWVDPLWLFSALGGLTGYLVGGRSRRAAFVAGSMGLLLTDVVHSVRMARAGGAATLLIGGAGAFDMVVLAGLIAVGLAEVAGELFERIASSASRMGMVLLALGLGLPVAGVARAAGRPAQVAALDERTDGGYYTLLDPRGTVLTLTARALLPGDGYIDARDRRWEVVRLDGDRIWMRPARQDPMPLAAAPAPPKEPAVRAQAAARPGRGLGPVAVYFTHSDESYVPTSGRASKPWGDVYAVGQALASSLRRHGYRVVVSRQNHNPHDGQAYLRSRRTALQLVREQPAVLVDVHRDAVPPHVYRTRLQGRPAVRVRLVVGRQNPQMAANLAFARQLKALADRQLPGVMEGIFLAHGNYNQDLSPRAVLVEFGAHSNSLAEARTTAELFAPLLAQAAALATDAGGPARQLGAAAWRAVASLLLATATAAAAYLAINRPQLLRELARRLRRPDSPELR